jgi:tRNA threonylcarbamoyladenosine biosynthesis protein TsaB
MSTAAVLAIDSATDACSVALWRDGEVAARRFEPRRHGQAEILMPMVREVMREASQDFAALTLIATTVGPGGFTGLRVGLAAARALALAAGKPVLGFTTLEAVAAAQPPGGVPLLVAIDSRRNDVYVQLFAPGMMPIGAPVAALPGDIAAMLPDEPVAIAGNAADAVLNALPRHALRPAGGPALPDAAVIARLAAERAESASPDAPPPSPLYLRPPDAKLPPGAAP